MGKKTDGTLTTTAESKRILGVYPESLMVPGPTLLISGAVHGNEPSGIQAIKGVFEQLASSQPRMKGQLVGVIGNLKALQEGKRSIDRDLNRVCTPQIAAAIKSGRHPGFHEAEEFGELLAIIEEIEDNRDCTGVRFMDLHTTSSHSAPYISVNKRPDNLRFANQIPLPVVSGIEDFIPGHFDHFLTLKGHLGFTLEAGQHEDPNSVVHQEAVIWLTLVAAGLIEEKEVPSYLDYLLLLNKVSAIDTAFRVIYRHEILPEDEFVMKQGFKNFDKIRQGDLLAYSNGQPILSEWDAHIFMPLYQNQGSDGFFIVEECQ